MKEPDDYKTNVRSRVQRSLVITIIPKQFVETVLSQMVLRAIHFDRKQVLPNSRLRPRWFPLFWKAEGKDGYLPASHIIPEQVNMNAIDDYKCSVFYFGVTNNYCKSYF